MSDRATKALQLISKDGITEKQLVNLLNNVKEEEQITEEERETLVDTIAKRLKVVSPSKAKVIFGDKGTEAIELLTKANDVITSKYNLTQNLLKNGVKTGGNMIAGDAYICHYLSYKNSDQRGCALTYFQESVETLPELRVKRYRTGKLREEPQEVSFSTTQFDDAVALYDSYLSTLTS